jgi:hypothetical protein
VQMHAMLARLDGKGPHEQVVVRRPRTKQARLTILAASGHVGMGTLAPSVGAPYA